MSPETEAADTAAAGNETDSAGSGTTADQDKPRGRRGGVKLTPRSFALTLPKDDEYFAVREDQIDQLAQGGRNMPLDWVFFFGGAGLGLLPSVLGTVASILNNRAPTVIEALLSVVAIACGAYAIAKFREHQNRKTDVPTLVAKIKSGQRMEIK